MGMWSMWFGWLTDGKSSPLGMTMITFLSGFGWLTDGKNSGPGAGRDNSVG